jgi:hypothetical protein
MGSQKLILVGILAGIAARIANGIYQSGLIEINVPVTTNSWESWESWEG